MIGVEVENRYNTLLLENIQNTSIVKKANDFFVFGVVVLEHHVGVLEQ